MFNEDGEEMLEDEGSFEERYVLTRVFHDSESPDFQEDDYSDGLTEQGMLEMLADRLGYTLTKNP